MNKKTSPLHPLDEVAISIKRPCHCYSELLKIISCNLEFTCFSISYCCILRNP